jgi:hypothetical protein
MNQIDMQQMVQGIGAANANAKRALAIANELAAGAGQSMKAAAQEIRRLVQDTAVLKEAVTKLEASRSGNPKIQYVENIPGRRVPFDLLVDIPIGAGVTSTQQGTITIPQDGPFVAVARYVTLQSQLQFQRIDPVTGATLTFAGRSFGRYRPTHSVWDIMDGQPINQVGMAVGFPGTGAPQIISPSNESSWRSMEGDFRFLFTSAGSSYPRSNLEVPSPFWTTQLNSPFPLGALDVFERGEVLTFKVLPTHEANPPFGNISGFGAPNANFPFLPSSWDAVEGISDPDIASANAVDPMTRLPNAIMTIGYHGYIIIQPPGGGPY